jgi:NADPH:quinone reductase-like Zn-dependent oxidoreductase
MLAVTIARFGGPDVLTVTDLPAPEPGPGQVSINVTHAAVGLAGVLMRRGEFGGAPPLVPGLEVAGTVPALGDGVTGLRIGEPVVTLSRPTAGGYAEVSTADAAITISLDDTDLDPALAVAALPNATTAVLALATVAHLQPGERLLVHGALGALGTVIAHVGRHLGAGRIIGTVRRAEQADTARQRGYDEVVLADESSKADANSIRSTSSSTSSVARYAPPAWAPSPRSAGSSASATPAGPRTPASAATTSGWPTPPSSGSTPAACSLNTPRSDATPPDEHSNS